MRSIFSTTMWPLLLVILAITSALGGHITEYLKKPEAWFQTPEAKTIATNILSWQASEGGWPKNVETTLAFNGEKAKLHSTFDNGATTDELRFLARIENAVSDPTCSRAFIRGLDHILKSQYANGGWPQFSPPPKDTYHRHITFNDNSMVRLLDFVREVAKDKRYGFVPKSTREACQAAFDRGLECILKCQVKVNGKLTVWCAQHDEIDFSPRPARSFELKSLSGSESVGIVQLLMSLEKPSPEVIRAVTAAAAWFESARLPGIKIIEVEAPETPKGKDKVVMKDAGAKPMWARFYDIESNRPIFSGRDGIKKDSLAEIEYERRNGYAWLGYWPERLLTADYPAWKSRFAGSGK